MGRLLMRYGFEPYDTESSARRVAELAADEIDVLRNELHQFRLLIVNLGDSSDLKRAKLALGYGMSATLFNSQKRN